MSWQRTTWSYLGPLQGCEPDDDPDREPSVDARKIMSTLAETPPADPPP